MGRRDYGKDAEEEKQGIKNYKAGSGDLRLAQKQECSFLNTREKRSATMSQGSKNRNYTEMKESLLQSQMLWKKKG